MRILLIEDDDIIADAIAAHFDRCGAKLDVLTDCVGLTADDIDAPFDVVVLDLGLPGRSGLAFLKALRADGATVPVLIFTARYEVDARVNALNLGADDYLTKPFDMRELYARCQALARRRGQGKPVTLNYRDLRLDAGAKTVARGTTTLALTPKVFGLFCHLIENQGRVLSRAHLEEHLYGWDGEAESNTLEVFISQIRRAVGSDYVRTVRGIGYIVPLTES